MKKVLKLHATNILNNPSVTEKIQSGLIIGEYISLIENEMFDQLKFNQLRIKHQSVENKIGAQLIPQTPARGTDWKYDENKSARLAQAKNRREWVFMMLDACYIDVEINAMEASCVLFLMADDLPLQFYKDFGSHIYDEARHAQAVADLLKFFPEFSPSKTYTNRVWNKVSLGKSVLEKIMIENVLEEGLAADKTVSLIEELKKDGFTEVAEVFEQINNDEIRHSLIGNKWVKYLLNENEEEYFSLFETLSNGLNPEARKIGSIQTRLASGFSKSFIKRFF